MIGFLFRIFFVWARIGILIVLTVGSIDSSFLYRVVSTYILDGDLGEVIFQHFLAIFLQFISQAVDPLNNETCTVPLML